MGRRVASRLLGGAFAILAWLASSLPGGGAQAQAPAPTPEQIEIFRNLTPEQQQAILDAMQNSSAAPPATGTAGAGGAVPPAGGQVSPLPTMLPRPAIEARERTPSGELRLAPDDTLLVEIFPLQWIGQERVLTVPDTQGQSGVRGSAAPAEPAVPGATGLPSAQSTAIVRDEVQAATVARLMDTVRRGNPYRISRSGTLDLPGLPPIPVAGLTAVEATHRLTVEKLLLDFRIRLTVLPLEPPLKPFGHDIFAESPLLFTPSTGIPPPVDYVVGPGDKLDVQLFGNTKGQYTLIVNPDGNINFPVLGPVPVSGLRFEDLRAQIEARVADQMIGTQVSVSIADLRSIRVFVLGDATRPGAYTVSGYATMTHALFAAGGVKPIGSLRRIQLRRQGQLVRTLDLYDMLLRGDTSNDLRLQHGDVVFVPPVGVTAALSGEVRRPAIYELKGEGTAEELLQLGGGLTPDADPTLARLERVDERYERTMVDVDLSGAAGRSLRLRTGDALHVQRVRPTLENSIQLEGHVLRPGVFQYRPGIRLTDVLPSVAELRPNADPHYVLIRRESAEDRRIHAVSADLAAAWRAPKGEADPMLAPRDRILVFDREAGRAHMIQPLLDELRMQSGNGEPTQVVRIGGRVNAPGDYPLEDGMTVSDLLRAGGGLTEDAYGTGAELARYEIRDGETRRTQVRKIDLSLAAAGDPSADVTLAPFDFLVVKEISQWATTQEIVHLEGQVKFPGDYPIEQGETLRSVIARAGGLTPLAFPGGSIFTREILKERERQQIEMLAERLKQDLAALALQGAQSGATGASQASNTLAIGQSLLADLRSAEPVGRLVIDLDRVLASTDAADDILLRDGDTLRVPRRPQEVTVIGEVQNATSHLYDPSLARDDYLRLSGGPTQKADDKRIYIVRANGSVESGGGSRWFGQTGSVQPGDTIVVPLDAERMRPLPLWTAVTTIIYNLAVAVAAVGSF
jgi:protein involved in polysaccharide export with SLBB domain